MKLLIMLAALAAPINPDLPARDPVAPRPPSAVTPAPAGAATRPQRPPAPGSDQAAPRTGASPLGVIGGKHDLSTSGPGPFKSDVESNACAFCHVPHGGARADGRPAESAPITPYSSSTSKARTASRPTGSSRICLSCHDGTIALGQTRTRVIKLRDNAPGGKLPAGHRANLGTDLRGTHPISFTPPPSKVAHAPPPGDAVHLDGRGELQCTACHDPHRETLTATGEGNFLVKSMQRASLCLTCHDAARLEAPDGSHVVSTSAITDPATGKSATLAELRCAACHVPHDGDKRGRLVRPSVLGDDAMCLTCHDGVVTRLDVAGQVRRPFAHAASTTGPSGHDLAEGPDGAKRLPETSPSAARHVTCVDCHEPHQATGARAAVAPAIQGAMAGTWGIDRTGTRVDPARYEYEVCFKCHSDSSNQPQARAAVGASAPRRATIEVNLRRVFEPSGASAHPVIGPGRNPVVPSLIAPLTASSVIYCSDCHASNDTRASGGTGPRGPHGSIYRNLLERNYLTQDGTPESVDSYALCYKCHKREVVLSTQSSFPLHPGHVSPGAAATLASAIPTPCSACHNAHGISSLVGAPAYNAHLIDFDLNVVKALPGQAAPRYTASGGRGGSCALVCHGKTHASLSY
jgi:predicted CXXCH cytochrome family protein